MYKIIIDDFVVLSHQPVFLITVSRFFENQFATYLIQDRILCIVYKSGITINLSAAIQIVKDRLLLQEGLPYRILCDARGVYAADKSARDYLALEGSTLVLAVAYLVEPTISMALSKFYLSINNPPIPSKVFTQKDEAIRFLEDFPE